jgi:glutamate racemase
LGAVVLGCTHFVLLEREFRTVLSDRIALIDSREGVTRRIVSLLGGVPVMAAEESPEALSELYLRGGAGEQDRYRAFARHFGLLFRGVLEETGG